MFIEVQIHRQIEKCACLDHLKFRLLESELPDQPPKAVGAEKQ